MKFCEATTIGLVDESRKSCTGARRAETCIASRYVDMRHVFFCLFFSNEQRGGGEGGAGRLSLLLSFPCSADHERDWPPCKVVSWVW